MPDFGTDKLTFTHRLLVSGIWATSLCVIAMPLGAARAEDLVINGSFDENVSNWASNNSLIDHVWDALDADGSVSSGSALVTSTYTAPNVPVPMTQCIDLSTTGFHDFEGSIYRPSGQSEEADVGFMLEWITGSCGEGGDRYGLTTLGNAEDTDSWELVEASLEPPVAAVSVIVHAWIRFSTKNEPDGAYQAYFDNIQFVPEPGAPLQSVAAALALAGLGWRRRRC